MSRHLTEKDCVSMSLQQQQKNSTIRIAKMDLSFFLRLQSARPPYAANHVTAQP